MSAMPYLSRVNIDIEKLGSRDPDVIEEEKRMNEKVIQKYGGFTNAYELYQKRIKWLKEGGHYEETEE